MSLLRLPKRLFSLERLLAAGFEVPKEAKDQHDNPVRQGKDEETGLPLEIRHTETGMHLVFIPAGSFMMGAPSSATGRSISRERPMHLVRIARPFYMGKYEVTVHEFAHFVELSDTLTQAERLKRGHVWVDGRWVWKPDGNWRQPGFEQAANHPVVLVSWNDAMSFINWFNKKEPLFGLPTEAQWEYACRAGTTTLVYFGSAPTSKQCQDHAWLLENSGGKTHPVGKKRPNPWGLYDILGNALEWIADWYGGYSGAFQTDPTGPIRGADRVKRGGCWLGEAAGLRCTRRSIEKPSYRSSVMGFRVTVAVPEEPRIFLKAEEEMGLLPASLSAVCEIPGEKEDKHGNPIREGRDAGTKLLLEIRHRETGIPLVLIPAGEFMMGSPDDEVGRHHDGREGPVRRVRVTKPFYLGKYEVTQAEWASLLDTNPSKFKGDRKPVEQLSWNHCQEFIKMLNAGLPLPLGEGRGEGSSRFSLPAEAQWEHACRAGTTTRFPYGDDPGYQELGNYAWHKANSSDATHPVGQKKPNAWALYDMLGNAWEWCEDRWHSRYSGAPLDESPWLNRGDHRRLLRGSAYRHPPEKLRSADRAADDPNTLLGGFRVALSLSMVDLAGVLKEAEK